MMDKFMEEHAPNVSKGWRTNYRGYRKRFVRFFGEYNVSEVTPKIIYRHKVERKNDECSPATLNRELACFSKAFSMAVKTRPYQALRKGD